MEVRELLLKTLEELVDEELEDFQRYCTWKILDSCKPIPRSRLQKASRMETVSKLTETYGEESAVSLTVEILQKMSMNELAKKLNNNYSAAASSSSAQNPPAAAPAAPGAPAAPAASIVAQQGSTVVMLTPTSSTTGAINVNINKPDN